MTYNKEKQKICTRHLKKLKNKTKTNILIYITNLFSTLCLGTQCPVKA